MGALVRTAGDDGGDDDVGPLLVSANQPRW